MFKKTYLFVGILLASLVLTNCKTDDSRKSEQKTPTVSTNPIKAKKVEAMDIIADTITYDVVVKNPHPDDAWTDECLKKLNRESLIDNIYEGIYNGSLKTLDYFTDEEMSAEQIKDMEQAEEFNRDNIGKLQFTEIWYMNRDNYTVHKKVQSVVLGYELKRENGDIKGYKPVFRVVW